MLPVGSWRIKRLDACLDKRHETKDRRQEKKVENSMI